MNHVIWIANLFQAHYTVRTLRIRHNRQTRRDKSRDTCNTRDIVQYQFTSWPDHGTPAHNITPVLSFIKKSSAACQESDGPLLVHCSAGVGRTGTYIVIDAMLKQLKSKGEINIQSYLSHIRHQRPFLVQTEEQYILIHDTLGMLWFIIRNGSNIGLVVFIKQWVDMFA